MLGKRILWRDRLLLSSLLALHGGAILLLLSCRLTRSHHWKPIRLPLSLSAGQRTSAQFTSDLDGEYLVQIDLKRNLAFEELNQLEPPDLGCAVTTEGTPVRFEPFQKIHYGEYGWSSTYWGDTWGVMIGQFRGAPGQPYTIRVRVKHAATTFQRLNPRLEVIVDPLTAEETMFKAALLQMTAILLLLIALTGLAVGTFRSIRRASRSRQERAGHGSL